MIAKGTRKMKGKEDLYLEGQGSCRAGQHLLGMYPGAYIYIEHTDYVSPDQGCCGKQDGSNSPFIELAFR